MECIFCKKLLLYAHLVNAKIPANFHYKCLGNYILTQGHDPEWNKDGSCYLNNTKVEE